MKDSSTFNYRNPEIAIKIVLSFKGNTICDIHLEGDNRHPHFSLFERTYARLLNRPLDEMAKLAPSQETDSWVELAPYLSMRSFCQQMRGQVANVAHPWQMICRCFGVSYPQIIELCHADPAIDRAGITAKSLAGGGCGSCQATIEAILREWRRGEEVASPATQAKPQREYKIPVGQEELRQLCHNIDDFFAAQRIEGRVVGVLDKRVLIKLKNLKELDSVRRQLIEIFFQKEKSLSLVFTSM